MVPDQGLDMITLASSSQPPGESPLLSASYQHPPSSPGASVQDNAVVCESGRHRSINVDDIVIAVMGITRAGKSTFINKATGRTEIAVTNDLTSQTRAVQPVRCLHPDGRRNIVLVDTPGFDDTYLSDMQILKIIAHWLKETYQDSIKLSGLLYLHRISDNRMAGAPLRHLSVFKDLCGGNNMKNVVLVTTMWDDEDEVAGSEREEHLTSVFWKDMIRLGSQTRRFRGTHESAWEIINCLDLGGSGQTHGPLQIQLEMVDRRLSLHQTMAAKTLDRPITQHVRRGKKFMAKLRNKFRRRATPEEPEKIPTQTLRSSPSQYTEEAKTTSTEPHDKLRQKAASRNPGTVVAEYLRGCLAQLAKVTTFSMQPRSGPSQSAPPANLVSRSPRRASTIGPRPSARLFPHSSRIVSLDSTSLRSRAESTASTCSMGDRQDTLLATIRILQSARQNAEIAGVPVLRGTIGTALHIAQLIQGMGGIHHAIIQVIENTAWLLQEVAQFTTQSQLSQDMKRKLRSFQRELDNLQSVVVKIAGRSRFLLHDSDVQTITVCTASMKDVYDSLEIKLVSDNRRAVARLEDRLTKLLTSAASRQRGYGMLNVPREALENERSPASTSKLAMDNRQAISQLEDQLMTLSENTALRKCECGTSIEEAEGNKEPSASTRQFLDDDNTVSID